MRAQFRCFRSIALLSLTLMLVSCPPEQSLDLIVDQSGTVADAAVSSLAGAIKQQIADDFVVAAGQSTITVVEWWGNEAPEDVADETFVIRFFEDDGSDHPEQIPLYAIPVGDASPMDTGQFAASGHPIYRYRVELTPFTLTPGNTYYLSIISRTQSWAWNMHSSGSGVSFSRNTVDGPWGSNAAEMAFRMWQ